MRIILSTIIGIICLPLNLTSQVDIYPVMPGIKINPDFSVRIDDGSGYRPIPVQDIVDVCFIHFAMTGTAHIEISVNEPIETWRIAPLKYGIEPAVLDNTMTFTLSEPEKLIVLINEGAGNHHSGLDGLCILADLPESAPPQMGDPDVLNIMAYKVDPTGVFLATDQIQKAFDDHKGQDKIIYFPPGIYQSGMLHMRDKQSLYLAPGAVLLGSPVYTDYPQIPGEGNKNEKYLIG